MPSTVSPSGSLQGTFSALMVLSTHRQCTDGVNREYGEIGSRIHRLFAVQTRQFKKPQYSNYLDEERGSDRLYPFDV